MALSEVRLRRGDRNPGGLEINGSSTRMTSVTIGEIAASAGAKDTSLAKAKLMLFGCFLDVACDVFTTTGFTTLDL